MFPESLHPHYEILRIVLIVFGIKLSVSPRGERFHVLEIVNLHPYRTRPWRTEDEYVLVYLAYFLQNGYHIIDILIGKREVLYAFLVAAGIFAEGEVGTSYGDTHITEPESFLGRKCLYQERLAVFLFHLHEVVACASGDGGTETVHNLFPVLGIKVYNPSFWTVTVCHILPVETQTAIRRGSQGIWLDTCA